MSNKSRCILTFYGLLICASATSEFFSGHGVLIQGLSIYVLILGLSFLASSWAIKSIKIARKIMLFSSWNIILYNIFAYVLLVMNSFRISSTLVVIFGILTLMLIGNISIMKIIKNNG